MWNPFKKKSDEAPAAAKLEAQRSTYNDEHTMPLEMLAKQLDTNLESGLSEAEAKMRLERDGPNSLTPPKKRPTWLKGVPVFDCTFCFIFVLSTVQVPEGDVQWLRGAALGRCHPLLHRHRHRG